jgi:hypothetical protein
VYIQEPYALKVNNANRQKKGVSVCLTVLFRGIDFTASNFEASRTDYVEELGCGVLYVTI